MGQEAEKGSTRTQNVGEKEEKDNKQRIRDGGFLKCVYFNARSIVRKVMNLEPGLTPGNMMLWQSVKHGCGRVVIGN